MIDVTDRMERRTSTPNYPTETRVNSSQSKISYYYG
jgi:hypothetical protein